MKATNLPYPHFTPNDRELLVGALIADGKTCREIAGSIGLIEYDVKYILHRLRTGLKAKSSAQVVAILLRHGMIKYNEDEKVHDIHWN